MAKRIDGVKCDDWRARLAKFDSSGLTIAEFCRRERVSPARFHYWARRIRQRDNSVAEAINRSAGCSMTSRAEATDEYVEVVVGDSIRVRMPTGQPDAVAALVRHLQDPPQMAGDSAATSRFRRIELTGQPAAQQ